MILYKFCLLYDSIDSSAAKRKLKKEADMKKRFILIITVILALVLAGCGENRSARSDSPILIDGVEYSMDSQSLDLSGTALTEWEKLTQFSSLTQLDLRNTGITTDVYERLQAAMPNCSIRWSVPFSEFVCDSSTQDLTLSTFSPADMELLRYLPELKTVDLSGCEDYPLITELIRSRPELDVNYTVTLGGTAYPADIGTLELADPDINELQKVCYLPNLTSVTLTGSLPSTEQLVALKKENPSITFLWDFDCFGIPVNTLTEYIDLSGILMEDTAALEALLPCFYNLQKVDMIGCGLSNEEMAGLNDRQAHTKFVWEVVVGPLTVRTDALYYMPSKYGVTNLRPGATENLKYCTDLVVLDLGHYVTVSDLTFLEYMPNLKILSLNSGSFTDLTPVGCCLNLEFFELFLSQATDLWPLTNCTSLKNLNLSYMPYGDPTPLHQMTWLDRLWLANSRLSDREIAELTAALPNTMMVFHSSSSTNRGWRNSPSYYEGRDLTGMNYMTR